MVRVPEAVCDFAMGAEISARAGSSLVRYPNHARGANRVRTKVSLKIGPFPGGAILLKEIATLEKPRHTRAGQVGSMGVARKLSEIYGKAGLLTPIELGPVPTHCFLRNFDSPAESARPPLIARRARAAYRCLVSLHLGAPGSRGETPPRVFLEGIMYQTSIEALCCGAGAFVLLMASAVAIALLVCRRAPVVESLSE